MPIVSYHLDRESQTVYSVRMWECKRCKSRAVGPRDYKGDLPPVDGWYRWQDDRLKAVSYEVGEPFYYYLCPTCARGKPPGITEVPHFHIPRTDEQ